MKNTTQELVRPTGGRGSGGNTLFGGSGDDILSATGGNNYLEGGDLNFSVPANAFAETDAGDDVLIGDSARTKIRNGARCAVLFGRSKFEAANDTEERMAA
jgi:hypothetical protein